MAHYGKFMKKSNVVYIMVLILGAVGLFIGTAVLLAQGATAETAVWQNKVDAWVLETAVSGQETEFLVYLDKQADVSGASALTTKEEKGAYVYKQLTAVAQRTQPAVIAMLKQENVSHRSYWISNMIWVRGNADIVEKLAQRNDVARIHANPHTKLSHLDSAALTTLLNEARTPEWNLTKVNAPDVWAADITGEGAIIGVQDTGFLWTHPALLSKYNGWVDGDIDHTYSWHDAIHEDNPLSAVGNPCSFDASAPCDDFGHGTHVLGIAVGDDGANNQIGLAPDAKWMGCRNMEQGYGSPASYSECFEWFVAPYPPGSDPMTDGDPSRAPHVVNNSWSCPNVEGCTDPNILRSVVDNVRQAGIVTVQAASNAGSFCGAVNTPAAIYDSSFTTGSTNRVDNISSFSARGPVVVDGSNRLKPDISAPGEGIRSSTINGGYGTSNGTSMATAHVSGLVGLLVSANPQLAGQVDSLEAIVTQTAVPRTTNEGCGGDGPTDVPNHTYGWGRIDAWEAYQLALDFPAHLTLVKQAHTDTVYAGHPLTYTLTITNNHAIETRSGIVLTDTFPSATTLITATQPFTQTGNVISWVSGELAPSEAWMVTLVIHVSFPHMHNSVVNEFYGARLGEHVVHGEAVKTAVRVHRAYLPIGRR